MNDASKELMDGIIEKAIKRLDELEVGTNEFAAALDDLGKLTSVVNSDRKSKADLAKASVEVDREAFTEANEKERLELDKGKEEFTRAIEAERLELDKSRHELDKEKLKTEKVRIGSEVGKKVIDGLIVGGTTLAICVADHNGWWVPKGGLANIPKIKL